MEPPNEPPPGGSGLDGPGQASSKAMGSGSSSQSGDQAQPLMDIFGADTGTASMVLVLLILNLIKASFTRCVC
jgi:hypothetical protein